MRTPREDVVTADPRANRLLAGLEPGAYRALAPHLRVLELRRDAVLLEAGEEAGHVWFPQDGVLALVTRLGGGATATGMVGREGMVDLASALGDHRAVSRTVVQVAEALVTVGGERF